MSDRIRLRQLRAFHAVMVTGGITSAADRLNLTQSAISKQLANLELALGIKLFHRHGGRAATPTQDGIDYYKAIETTIAGLDELELLASNIKARGRRRIRIAATPPLINSTPLMNGLSRFLEEYPETAIALEPRHRLEIEDWVATRRIDLALALLPCNHPGLQSIPIVDTEAVASFPPDHALARQSTISVEMLSRWPIILPSRQPLRTRLDATMEQEGIALDAKLESSSAITCCRMAASGLGVALCDPFSPTAFSATALTSRPIQPSTFLTYGALVHRTLQPDTSVKALLELLQQAFGGTE